MNFAASSKMAVGKLTAENLLPVILHKIILEPIKPIYDWLSGMPKRLSRNLQEIAFVGNEVFLESALRQVLFQAFAEDQPVVFVECDQAAVEGGVVEAERQMPLRSWCKEPRPSCLLKPLKPLGKEVA